MRLGAALKKAPWSPSSRLAPGPRRQKISMTLRQASFTTDPKGMKGLQKDHKGLGLNPKP